MLRRFVVVTGALSRDRDHQPRGRLTYSGRVCQPARECCRDGTRATPVVCCVYDFSFFPPSPSSSHSFTLPLCLPCSFLFSSPSRSVSTPLRCLIVLPACTMHRRRPLHRRGSRAARAVTREWHEGERGDDWEVDVALGNSV